ncbi:MAG TPA: LPS export ABC transporter permease LptG [Pseudomonadales bacterium]|nr:LPS export ABC transporter permease LptG [Pseudomonadales bacterium]
MIPDRLDRHVAAQVLRTSLLVAAVFISLDWLLAFIDQIDDRGPRWGGAQILWNIALTTPRRLWELMPYVALLGALAGLSVLATQGELVVMRAAGRRLERITAAALLPALALVAAGVVLGEGLGPATEARAQLERALARSDGGAIVRGGSWHLDRGAAEGAAGRADGEGISERVTHARRLDPDGGLADVTQYGFDAAGALLSIRRARRARPEGEAVDGAWQWRLVDVRETRLTPAGVVHRRVDELPWRSTADGERFRLDALVPPDRLPFPDLLARLRQAPESGAVAAADRARWRLALWRRLLQPVAAIALVLVGAAFVFGPLRERSAGTRLVAGIAVGVLFRYAQDLLGPASLVFGFPPVIAVLLPILVAAATGVVLLRRAG